jgi:hypothetical protein
MPYASARRTLATLLAPVLAVALALAACAGAPTDPGDDDPGALAVLVSGLPAGAAAAVTVSGPSGFADAITASETYAGLAPGSYAVAAASVAFEGVTYAATVAGSPADVPSGGLATATVAYAATSTAPGALTVTVEGLPGGVDAAGRVTGPGGFDQTLTATTTLAALEPGTYLVAAAEVDDAGDAYGASVAGSPALVPAGGAAAALVSYAFLDPTSVGSLDVAITGLPAGADAAVTVTGPGAFDQDLTASATLTDLTVGTYVVSAANVTADGLTYQGVVTGSPALVIGAATTDVAVAYQVFTPDDGDAASAPGLFARFRATSPNPVWVEGLLFNAATPIDTKGIELRDALGNPADPGDWLAFELVHGQAPTTSLELTLACSDTGTPSPIRVELRDEDGAKIGLNTLCNTTRTIAVPNEGGTGDYVLHVIPQLAEPYFTAYVLSVDAYCFQACAYQPFEP